MNKILVLLVLLMILLTTVVSGQKKSVNKNVQDYTPSLLINKGQTEFKLFNSLYTQSQFFNAAAEKLDAGGRSNFFTSIIEYNYGVSSKVTLGGEVWYRAVSNGTTTSSATNVLAFTNSSQSRSGINLAGFKIKFNPIRKWKKLSVQSGLLLSVISDPQSEKLDRPFLDNNRHLWISKLLYDIKISSKFQAFTQLSTWVSIDKNLEDENTGIATPVDLFISYFPSKKFTIYLQNQFWPSLGSEGISSYFVQEGLGIKYQLAKGVELESSYTAFVIGKDTGAGQTFNFGVRILH
tara:strand:- start:4239 stop:5117 length:879 start_codon:yes stop_codon:yes gene_type:complete